MILEVKVPAPGESISEVELGAWLVKSGDVVKMDAELVEINSDKATLTINAEGAGKVEILRKEGETVRVGDVIAKIDTSAAAAATPTPEQKAPEVVASKDAPAKENSYAKGVGSVSAEKLSKEQGIQEGAVAGTGRDGRVTKTDVVEHLKNQANSPNPENGKPKQASRN